MMEQNYDYQTAWKLRKELEVSSRDLWEIVSANQADLWCLRKMDLLTPEEETQAEPLFDLAEIDDFLNQP